MPRTSRLLIVIAAMILLPACQSDKQPNEKNRPGAPTTIPAEDLPPSLGTLTLYPEPKKTELKAPDGFQPVFAQNVARHGARSLTSDDSLEDAIELWDEAKAAGALTSAGKKFGPDVRALYNAMDRVGFGQLNTLGAEEMQGIGTREGERLSSMFDAAPADGAQVDVLDSGRGRAEASARNFSIGLSSVHPDIQVEPPESEEKLLKFDKEDKAYEKFLDDGPWRAPYHDVREHANIDDVAVDALEYLYTPEFVAGLDDQMDEAYGIYDVYRSGPAMSREINVDTSRYMSEKNAETFAYVEDGRYFYARGPGMEGDDSSYRAAQVLLDDFFKVIDDRLEGRGSHPHAAVYRFAHAEEITPFAALLELPGSDEKGKPGEMFTYENNDFRISTVSPLSANISWVVWEKGDKHIVSVEHNEVPRPVGRDCKPYQDTENFYELEELRTCLGATPATP